MCTKFKAISIILNLHPWGRRKYEKAVGAYLDGNPKALDGYPMIKALVDKAWDSFSDTD